MTLVIELKNSCPYCHLTLLAHLFSQILSKQQCFQSTFFNTVADHDLDHEHEVEGHEASNRAEKHFLDYIPALFFVGHLIELWKQDTDKMQNEFTEYLKSTSAHRAEFSANQVTNRQHWYHVLRDYLQMRLSEEEHRDKTENNPPTEKH